VDRSLAGLVSLSFSSLSSLPHQDRNTPREQVPNNHFPDGPHHASLARAHLRTHTHIHTRAFLLLHDKRERERERERVGGGAAACLLPTLAHALPPRPLPPSVRFCPPTPRPRPARPGYSFCRLRPYPCGASGLLRPAGGEFCLTEREKGERAQFFRPHEQGARPSTSNAPSTRARAPARARHHSAQAH
jgi:hypothetical protein